MTFLRDIAALLAGDASPASLVAGVVLAAARIWAILRVLPLLGGGAVPFASRAALALALACAVGGPLPGGAAPPAEVVALLALKEAGVGLVMGLLVALPIHFLEQAGFLVDAGRGGAQSQLLSPSGEEAATPFSALFFLLAALLFFATPARDAFFLALARSFDAVPLVPPPGEPLVRDAAALLDLCLRTTGALFLSSVLLALPVLALVLVADLLTGLLGRFTHSGSGYFVALPLRSAAGILGGMLLLLLAVPSFERMLATGLDALGALLGIYR